MKTIRASEISSYCYCHRAWWYQQRGIESENQAEISGGDEIHALHGWAVMSAGCLNLLAYAFLVLAVLALTVWIVGQIV